MPALTDRDKRTLRLASIAIAVYLVLFFSLRGWSRLEANRRDYQLQIARAQKVTLELLAYETKVLKVEKLRKAFRLDPSKLSKATLVAEASAAIQQAAKTGGVQLGPIRESPARPSAKELASVQLEGSGQVAAILKFLQRLESLGYPLALDAVQVTPAPNPPGMVKLSLTIVILDYEQWKNEEARNA